VHLDVGTRPERLANRSKEMSPLYDRQAADADCYRSQQTNSIAKTVILYKLGSQGSR